MVLIHTLNIGIREVFMLTLDAIQSDSRLLNEIDWEMTPEDAVTRYLEWGNNPALGNHRVRSKNDYSVYFVVNTWRDPVVYLIRRNSEGAEELAAIDIPEPIRGRFLKSMGQLKGVYPVEGEVRDWLRGRLYNA